MAFSGFGFGGGMKGNWEMGLPLKQAVVLHRRTLCFSLFPSPSSLCIIVVELDASLLYLVCA